MYRGTSWAAGLHTNPPGCRATFLVFRTRGGRSLRHASQRDDAPDGAIRTAIFSNGRVERYNARGKHLGEFDPETGEQLSPPDPTRKVEP
jgi:hypothetical protein